MAESNMSELGEDLEIAGDVVATEGAMEMLDGAEDLDIARDAAAIGVAEVAAAASDLTRAEDAAFVAERVQHLSDVMGEAGVVDVAEGVDMLMTGADVRAMGVPRRSDQRRRVGARSGTGANGRRTVDN